MRPTVCLIVLASVVALSTAARAETPPSFLFEWDRPHAFSIAVGADGYVYVADDLASVSKCTAEGANLTRWGSGGSGDGLFNGISGVAVDGIGNVYVADVSNHRIQKFDGNGAFLTKWGALGTRDGEFRDPAGVAVDVSGNVYVVDQSNNRIQKFDGNGAFLSKWGSLGGGDGDFDRPKQVAVDGSGNVYVADKTLRIQKFPLEDLTS